MIEYIGNIELLNVRKTAFFAPGKISVTSVMPTYDWATEMAKSGQCVISSFKSKLETDVWHFLLRGKQPLIIVFARKKHYRLPQQYTELISSGRLLIIYLGICDERNGKASLFRNEYIAEIADKFTRNEIMTSNEFRQIIGMKPSDDPKADKLWNSNISHPEEEEKQVETSEPTEETQDKGGQIQNGGKV